VVGVAVLFAVGVTVAVVVDRYPRGLTVTPLAGITR
jgi:hypothetical protein